jgi:hypothetical protein
LRVKVYDNNLNEINLASMDVDTSDFKLDPPTPKHDTTDMRFGRVTLGSGLEPRSMSVTFHLHGRDMYDFILLRDEMFDYFNGLEFMYLVDVRNPAKRWKVKVAASYEVVPIATRVAVFDMEFISDSPYCHSIGTTDDPVTFEADKWQFGQGIIFDESIKYTHTTDSFKIYNAGNVDIDPRLIHTPLTIEVTAAATSSNNILSLTNLTTGEVWTYTGATTAGQVIQLKDVQALTGGSSVFLKTNYKVITLKRGYNDFVKSNTISQVKFINRFYYK